LLLWDAIIHDSDSLNHVLFIRVIICNGIPPPSDENTFEDSLQLTVQKQVM
jgi:hypothetical protein